MLYHLKVIKKNKGGYMAFYTASQARTNLFKIIDEVNVTHEPVYIKSKRSSAVILSKEDYDGLQETLAIYSVPGLAKSILEASNSPKEEFVEWTDEL
jgi:antitoxin YefM